MGLDEIMVVTIVHDHAARVRSYELLAEAFDLRATFQAETADLRRCSARYDRFRFVTASVTGAGCISFSMSLPPFTTKSALTYLVGVAAALSQ